MNNCGICGKDKRIIAHHLSYEPEIIMDLCWGCHVVVHRLSERSQEQRKIIFDLVKQYGHLWGLATPKHVKTKCYNKIQKNREARKDYQKNPKYKGYLARKYATDKYKEYQREYILKKDPEKFFKILEDLEKKSKLIGGGFA